MSVFKVISNFLIALFALLFSLICAVLIFISLFGLTFSDNISSSQDKMVVAALLMIFALSPIASGVSFITAMFYFVSVFRERSVKPPVVWKNFSWLQKYNPETYCVWVMLFFIVIIGSLVFFLTSMMHW